MGKVFENLKGTYDYLPEKQILRENIQNKLRDIFKIYGFAPLETPILCYYDLLASKYSEGADILNEIYKLNDQGKRDLGLRYDLTITFCKLISSDPYMPMPFKRYEIGKVFRDGPVRVGRNREFTQCDVDMVGVSNLMAEAEYLTMTEEAYRELGLDVEILVNHRKLLSGMIQAVLNFTDEKKIRESVLIIDKFAKLSKSEFHKEFEKIGVGAEKVDELINILNLPVDGLGEKLKNYPENENIKTGLSELDELKKYLKNTAAETRVTFAPYLARGIDIYTGVVWEIFLKSRKIGDQDFGISLGGGGRYDKIITDFIDDGKIYPAVGMSFGLDVIYEALRLQSVENKNNNFNIADLYILPMQGSEADAFQFASKLRQIGVRTEIEKRGYKVKKGMNYANKAGIPYVIVLGGTEFETGQARIKNMKSGENKDFNMNQPEEIREYIAGRRE